MEESVDSFLEKRLLWREFCGTIRKNTRSVAYDRNGHCKKNSIAVWDY